MRLFLSLAGLLLLWYLGAMYRSAPLLVLFLLGVLLLAAMALELLLCRKQFSVQFPAARDTCQKGEPYNGQIRIENRGRLPAGRIQLALSACYAGSPAGTVRTLSTGVEALGGCDLAFQLQPPGCGLITVQIQRVRIWDALALLSARQSVAAAMELAVFPPERTLRLTDSATWAGNSPEGPRSTARRGEDPPDYFQLRPFREGDSARQIHWKQSARTGQLLSRDFAKDTDTWFHLHLGTGDAAPVLPEAWDAFYEVLSALLLGLLEIGAAVRVSWAEEGAQRRSMDITGPEGRCPLLWTLYHAHLEPLQAAGLPAGCLTLDTGLNWRRDGLPIHQFSPAELPAQLGLSHFTI